MKKIYFNFIALAISVSCICGMCSKTDDQNNNNNGSNPSNPNNPVLKPEDTWVYFDDCPNLVEFYNSQPNATGFNTRPQFQQWIATKINVAFAGINTVTQKRFLSWDFENTGNTRFLSNTLNPSGKETMSFLVNEISNTPGPGTYTLDIDGKGGMCWYYVYTSSGALHDSTRVQGIQNSTVNIIKMDFFQAIGTVADRYKMSGTATFNIMYWKSGTGSTTDIYTLQCTFNNVYVDFMK